MLIDLHVHIGDNGLDPRAVLDRAPALGLDGVAFVGDNHLPDLQALRGGKVRAFSGAIVTTDRGRYLVFLPEPHTLPPLADILGPPVQNAFAVRDVVARVRALGGAVVAAHPYDATIPSPGGDILFTLPTLAAVESVNSRRPPEIAIPAIEAAETLGLPCTGGSCARKLEEVGRAATLFTRPIEDEAGLVAALRSGACWPVEFGDPPHDLAKRKHQHRERFDREPSSAGAPPREGGGSGTGRRRRRR